MKIFLANIFLILLMSAVGKSQNSVLESGLSLKADLAGLTFVPSVIEPRYFRASIEGEFQIRSIERWTVTIDLEAAHYEEQFERYFGNLWLRARSYQNHFALHVGPRFYVYEFTADRPINGVFVEPQIKIAGDFAEIFPDNTVLPTENVSEFNLGWRLRLGLQGFFTKRLGFSVSGDVHQRKFVGSGKKQLEILPEVNFIFKV